MNAHRKWRTETLWTGAMLSRKRNGEPAEFAIVERWNGCYFFIWIDSKKLIVLPLPWSSLRSNIGRTSLKSFLALPPTAEVSLRPSPLLKNLVQRSILPIPTLLGSGLSMRKPTVFYEDSYSRDVSFDIIVMNRFSSLLKKSTSLSRKCLGYRTPEKLFEQQRF